jgi:hypothetical protein
MSDPHLKDADIQHHANPNYQGIDYFAVDFVKRREAVLAAHAAQQSGEPSHPETTAVVAEKDVAAQIGESNAKYAAGALKREILNSYYNHPLILHDFATGRGRTLPPGQGKGPALIIGSGPTLDEAHDLVRGWQGGLFCSSSQCVAMLALGKREFNIVAVDVKTLSNEFQPMDAFEGRDCTLITHSGMDPELIQTWRGKKLYFRIVVHGIPYYTEISPIAYPMITTSMYVYGCVVACQIMMASMMGYNPLYLVGCDFGYPEERSRFTNFHRKDDGSWEMDPTPEPVRYTIHPKVVMRNGCASDHFQAYYKQTLFNVWRLTMADIFRVGSKGCLYELPGISAAELLATQGNLRPERMVYSQRDKQNICERYLQQYGTYTFEYPNGQVEFVVFTNKFTPGQMNVEAACGACGKPTKNLQASLGPLCDGECMIDFQLKKYIEMVNNAMAQAKVPGVLILGEEKGRVSYLRNDAVWEAKEKRWQWETLLQQSPTATGQEESSENG